MRKTNGLTRKIAKLERQAGMRGSIEIPAGVKTVYFFNQKQGQPHGEIDAEIETKRDELVEKYGQRILHRLRFIRFVEVDVKAEKGSQSLKKHRALD